MGWHESDKSDFGGISLGISPRSSAHWNPGIPSKEDVVKAEAKWHKARAAEEAN